MGSGEVLSEAQLAEIRAHGTCSDANCGEMVAGQCEWCGRALCAGGLFMHATVGCAVAWKMERRSGDGQQR